MLSLIPPPQQCAVLGQRPGSCSSPLWPAPSLLLRIAQTESCPAKAQAHTGLRLNRDAAPGGFCQPYDGMAGGCQVAGAAPAEFRAASCHAPYLDLLHLQHLQHLQHLRHLRHLRTVQPPHFPCTRTRLAHCLHYCSVLPRSSRPGGFSQIKVKFWGTLDPKL